MFRLFKNQKGQGLVEYLIIVAIMAVGTMAIMRIMNQTVSSKFARVTATLQGNQGPKIHTAPLEEEHFKKRDMSDFFHGAVSNDNTHRGQ